VRDLLSTIIALQGREIRLLNDVLPAEAKYAIADEITVESRSRSDVVQDVWDALVSRGLLRGPKRELVAEIGSL
jgi:hypothetical protein